MLTEKTDLTKIESKLNTGLLDGVEPGLNMNLLTAALKDVLSTKQVAENPSVQECMHRILLLQTQASDMRKSHSSPTTSPFTSPSRQGIRGSAHNGVSPFSSPIRPRRTPFTMVTGGSKTPSAPAVELIGPGINLMQEVPLTPKRPMTKLIATGAPIVDSPERPTHFDEVSICTIVAQTPQRPSRQTHVLIDIDLDTNDSASPLPPSDPLVAEHEHFLDEQETLCGGEQNPRLYAAGSDSKGRRVLFTQRTPTDSAFAATIDVTEPSPDNSSSVRKALAESLGEPAILSKIRHTEESAFGKKGVGSGLMVASKKLRTPTRKKTTAQSPAAADHKRASSLSRQNLRSPGRSPGRSTKKDIEDRVIKAWEEASAETKATPTDPIRIVKQPVSPSREGMQGTAHAGEIVRKALPKTHGRAPSNRWEVDEKLREWERTRPPVTKKEVEARLQAWEKTRPPVTDKEVEARLQQWEKIRPPATTDEVATRLKVWEDTLTKSQQQFFTQPAGEKLRSRRDVLDENRYTSLALASPAPASSFRVPGTSTSMLFQGVALDDNDVDFGSTAEFDHDEIDPTDEHGRQANSPYKSTNSIALEIVAPHLCTPERPPHRGMSLEELMAAQCHYDERPRQHPQAAQPPSSPFRKMTSLFKHTQNRHEMTPERVARTGINGVDASEQYREAPASPFRKAASLLKAAVSTNTLVSSGKKSPSTFGKAALFMKSTSERIRADGLKKSVGAPLRKLFSKKRQAAAKDCTPEHAARLALSEDQMAHMQQDVAAAAMPMSTFRRRLFSEEDDRAAMYIAKDKSWDNGDNKSDERWTDARSMRDACDTSRYDQGDPAKCVQPGSGAKSLLEEAHLVRNTVRAMPVCDWA